MIINKAAAKRLTDNLIHSIDGDPSLLVLYGSNLGTAEGIARELVEIVKLHTAFSRQDGKPKTYVQHLMKENSEKLLHMLMNKGKLYVCGDGSQMAPAVEETLRKAYQEVKGATMQQAKDWLIQLQAEGRYVQDVWAGNK